MKMCWIRNAGGTVKSYTKHQGSRSGPGLIWAGLGRAFEIGKFESRVSQESRERGFKRVWCQCSHSGLFFSQCRLHPCGWVLLPIFLTCEKLYFGVHTCAWSVCDGSSYVLGCPDVQVSTTSECVCELASGWDEHLNLQTEWNPLSSAT